MLPPRCSASCSCHWWLLWASLRASPKQPGTLTRMEVLRWRFSCSDMLTLGWRSAGVSEGLAAHARQDVADIPAEQGAWCAP
mmetsp:Transcript_36170/g.91029  ORF Transcript_36170/g.91029 Transcript_36170/m.91029 type:complete len:82 (-) Transcript_36170:73-318(-)